MSRILAIILFLLLAGCSISNELSESEQRILFSELDFAELGVEAGDKPAGQYEKIIDYANASTDLSYLKDSEAGDKGFYLQSTVTIERMSKNVVISELGGKAGTAIGLKLGGFDEEPVKLSGRYGSKASLSLLKMEGKPVGNSFSVVMGNKIVSLFFVGTYFDKGEAFETFVQEKMARVKAYSGK